MGLKEFPILWASEGKFFLTWIPLTAVALLADFSLVPRPSENPKPGIGNVGKTKFQSSNFKTPRNMLFLCLQYAVSFFGLDIMGIPQNFCFPLEQSGRPGCVPKISGDRLSHLFASFWGWLLLGFLPLSVRKPGNWCWN